MGKKVSLDEVLSKRKDGVGKSAAGNEAMFKGSSAPTSWDKDERSAVFVMTTEEQDRDMDIVVQAGIDLTHFMKNPQALIFHNSRSWPVGGWNDVKMVNGRPKRHEGRLKFLPADGPVKEIDQAAWMVENGGIKTVSIGFMPKDGAIEYVDEEKGWWGGLKFLETELYECSLVPIPAHPSALVKSAAGEMTLAKDLIEEILDTYAKDPRTGGLIERKLYEDEYFFLVGSKKQFDGLTFNGDFIVKGQPKVEEPNLENKNAATGDEGGEAGAGTDTKEAVGGTGDPSATQTEQESKEAGTDQPIEAKPSVQIRKSITGIFKSLLGLKSEDASPPEPAKQETVFISGSYKEAKDRLALLRDAIPKD